MNEQPLAFHPASGIFPLLEGEDLEELAQDIREYGLREAITLHPDGSILDGRNRYRACLQVGIEPRFVTWHDNGSPVSYVISLNLKRRQLTTSQCGMIALKAKPLLEAEARDRQATSLGGKRGGVPLDTRVSKGRSDELAGKAVGVSRETVRRAQVVVDHGVPELAEAVKAGEISVKRAALLADLPSEEQRRALAGGSSAVKAATSRNEEPISGRQEQQAPAGVRRLPKQDDVAAVHNYLHALQGVCLGLDKLNTCAIRESQDVAELCEGLAGVQKSLRKFYRSIGGNGGSSKQA